ncbi:MAG TPA: serine hydrolase [Acidobacteriaceae bacterium]
MSQCATLLVLASLPLAAAAQRTPRNPKDPAIAKLQMDIPGWMEQGDVPGLSVAVLRHGRAEWIHGFGVANKENARAVDENTIFNIASLSKTVFSYAVLRLVDQGKLDLDTPLTHYLPDRIVDDARLDAITARIVLSHRTGFPNWRPNGGKLQILFTPGERFSYSGEGMVYLSKVVEAVSGKPLNDVMQEQVFTPLGMTASSYIAEPAAAEHFSTAYSADGKAVPLFQSKTANAAASLNTSAHDYALFLEAILAGRGLKPATLRQMETPQIAVDPECTNCTTRVPKKLATDLFWGLGWGIEKNATGTYLWHWGDNGVYKAYVVVDIKRRSALFMAANGQNGLSVAKAITVEALGGEHPSFTWLKYDAYDSPNLQFTRALHTRGVAPTMQDFAPQLAKGEISEGAVNSAGYMLLREKKYPEAIEVLKQNVTLHPASSNGYDSLGEAYMDAGEKDLAIKSYEKALELDPGASGAKAMLAKLRATPDSPTTH